MNVGQNQRLQPTKRMNEMLWLITNIPHVLLQWQLQTLKLSYIALQSCNRNQACLSYLDID
jgi:hypothetical protein